MVIHVNGEQKEFPENLISVAEILKKCKVEMPDMVSVQLNGAFVEKKEYESAVVKNGDEIDFLYFMGGGWK
ncbi:MAG: sulfur carrier protein ThiS [Fibrobacter sp.]|nr:sulfur carrier protein ThiS [Fibrobacter sp.]